MPGDGLIESRAPFRESTLLFREIRAFVRNVVHEAHERIESSQSIALGLWQEEKSVIEIAVGAAGDAMAFFVGLRDRRGGMGRSIPTRSGQVLRPYNCGWWHFLNRDRIWVYQMSYQRAAQERGLLHFADCRAAVESVISHRLDGIEYGETAASEHLEVHAEASIHDFCQRMAFGKEDPRARDEIFHQTHVALIEATFNDVALGEPLRRGGIKRNVNPPDFQITGDILPEVGELQRRTSG